MNIQLIKRKIRTVLNRPRTLVEKIIQLSSPLLSDRVYLRLLFPIRVGYRLNLKKPKTYNEKLQWLKLNYRKPIMTTMVDKFEAKSFIKDVVGEKYIVKNLGVWRSFSQIDFDTLPSQFVLKTTHDQGGVVICTDKTNFNYRDAKKKLENHLKRNHYLLSREWPYKNVKPRILAEVFLNPSNNSSFKDYKFYCFDGEPKVMYVSMGKNEGNMTFDYFDMDYNVLNIERPNIKNSNKPSAKPRHFDTMIALARKLSHGFPHLRVDFFEVDNQVYVGELTFFQGGGLMPFIPRSWDYTFGEWINLEVAK